MYLPMLIDKLQCVNDAGWGWSFFSGCLVGSKSTPSVGCGVIGRYLLCVSSTAGRCLNAKRGGGRDCGGGGAAQTKCRWLLFAFSVVYYPIYGAGGYVVAVV